MENRIKPRQYRKISIEDLKIIDEIEKYDKKNILIEKIILEKLDYLNLIYKGYNAINSYNILFIPLNGILTLILLMFLPLTYCFSFPKEFDLKSEDPICPSINPEVLGPKFLG